MLQPTDRFYSVTEAAQRLGVSRMRVHQLIDQKRLQVQKIANIFVIPESSLRKYESTRRGPGRPRREKQ